MLIDIEKGDIIATKDGRSIRVLAVYRNDSVLSRIEGVDDTEISPMRRPVFSADILRILRKAPKPVVQDDRVPLEEKLAPAVKGVEDKDRKEERETFKKGDK